MPEAVSKHMNPEQRRALTIALILALLFGAYFLRNYFSIIALSAIVAYLFNPVYKWLLKITKGRANMSVMLTLLVSVITITIPLTIILAITVDQALQLVEIIKKSAFSGPNASNFMQNLISTANHVVDKVPGHAIQNLSYDQVVEWIKNNLSGVLKSAVSILVNLAGGFTSFLTKSVIYVFIFISFLVNQQKIVHIIHRLNPLGDVATNLYLQRMASMTSAMVKGQFVIALIQGVVDATLLRIVGIDFFVLWLVLITFLSIIPLGGGIIVLPVGIVMLLTGHIWQGILLIAGHILIVTNIDNVLRPRFVPKTAQLDSALTILSVFAGIAMYGFLGIVIGPVVMIVIVTTIQVYLAALNADGMADAEPNRRTFLIHKLFARFLPK